MLNNGAPTHLLCSAAPHPVFLSPCSEAQQLQYRFQYFLKYCRSTFCLSSQQCFLHVQRRTIPPALFFDRPRLTTSRTEALTRGLSHGISWMEACHRPMGSCPLSWTTSPRANGPTPSPPSTWVISSGENIFPGNNEHGALESEVV